MFLSHQRSFSSNCRMISNWSEFCSSFVVFSGSLTASAKTTVSDASTDSAVSSVDSLLVSPNSLMDTADPTELIGSVTDSLLITLAESDKVDSASLETTGQFEVTAEESRRLLVFAEDKFSAPTAATSPLSTAVLS